MQNEDIKLFKKRKAEEAEPHIKTRDPVYYQEHGDRIFLVDNVFFKVRRHVLVFPCLCYDNWSK